MFYKIKPTQMKTIPSALMFKFLLKRVMWIWNHTIKIWFWPSEVLLWKTHTTLQLYWALYTSYLFWYTLLNSDNVFLAFRKITEIELFTQLFNVAQTLIPFPLWNWTSYFLYYSCYQGHTVSEQTGLSSDHYAF